MRSFVSTLLVVLVCCVLTGCGSKESQGVAAELAEADAVSAAPMESVASLNLAASKATQAVTTMVSSQLSALSVSEATQYLIRTATLRMEVDSAPTVAREIAERSAELGGYASDQSRSKIGEDRYSVSLTVRLPVQEFDSAVADFQELGSVLQFQSRTQDVSEEFVDTSARVTALERTEERLLDHLNRAAKLEDIIRAEQEIGRVRSNIEQLQGRLRYLSNRVTYSTVNIVLEDTPRAERLVPQQKYSMMSEVSAASQSLVEFGQGALTKLVWAGVWSPVWLPMLLAFAFVTRKALVKMRATA